MKANNQITVKNAAFAAQSVILTVAGLAVLLGVSNAGAVGLRDPNQDPDAIARGNAFVATADNPAAIYYNPAGISQLEGDQFHVGAYLISEGYSYSSALGKSHADDSVQFIPQIYYTHQFTNTPFTAGVGVYAPFGLSMDWGKTAPFALVAQNGSLVYGTINPVLSYQVTPTLSIAAGPTVNYVRADLNSIAFKFTGDDATLGGDLGILWKPVEEWSFGLRYFSPTHFTLNGKSASPALTLPSASTTAGADIPQYVTAGISYRPTTNWNVEVDVDWTDWDSLDVVNFKRADGITLPFAFNYKSSWMYGIGVTRQLGNGWYVSAGYLFSENSSPDGDFNPLVPDGDYHLGGLGVGHRGERWDWSVGYQFAYGNRDVTGSPNPTVNGNYKTFNNALNVSITYKF